MKRLSTLILLFFCSLMPNQKLNSQADPTGIFFSNTDIGAVKHQGNVSYLSDDQEYLIEGSGKNMWFDDDQFHYLWKSIQGDFILRAQIKFVGSGVDPHRKIGWMARNSFRPDSEHVSAAVHGDGLVSLQFRDSLGGDTNELPSKDTAPDIIELERRGSTFIMGTAKLGQPLNKIVYENSKLKNEVFIGLFVCSHNPDVVEKAIFRNVRIIKPFDESGERYQDYLGSHMEVLDVETLHRKILFSSAHSIQAPNWTPDGKALIYNSNGYLHRYDLKSGKTSTINTGFAVRNNNDHVLSFDGKQLAISHHDDQDNGDSAIYTLPVEGSSQPVRVTKKGLGPSYLHGWSVDARELVFTGSRNDQYDIYSVDIATGKETQLTNTEGLDDGPEYDPSGKFIYFNSNRSGTMQLYRMKPDGSEVEQLTFDELNDWFPHISPDGKKILFLSFGTDVESGDHPFYKHVYLRMMSVDGGDPKILSYVYGGQGTINVPSWSPDSKKVAFVSNSN
ncbi:biopolymer transporter TolR [Lutimonas saemankumensis]|uniref:TolB family protein n=1 Tax=Lutimonas saemankumensis TaxID=483016 RepID=UPI001CD1A637|nr:biopolymer transporter TolR [Lutimonas saemankumensis]MCA0933739.1 biopolymer transporter TolR [Lutimonas saemankumensis]